MQAIILAGGFGTRLAHVVSDVPKPMAEVCGRPFLEFILDKLVKEGCSRVVLAVGYKKEYIMNYFKNSYRGMEIFYSEENEPLGTGGCIIKALSWITEDMFYVLNGDTFFDVNLQSMKTKAKMMIACCYMEDFSRYGKVEIDSNHKIVSFLEKKEHQTGYINGGIYLLRKDTFDSYQLEPSFSLEKDFFEKYIDELSIEAFLSKDYFIDIGVPEDYYKAQEDLKNV